MNDKKPREFWIDITGEIGDALEAELHTSKPECWDKERDEEASIHVIEKSAYDRCVEVALNTMTRCNNILNERDQLRTDLDLAIEAMNTIEISIVNPESMTAAKGQLASIEKLCKETIAKLQGEKK